MINKNIVKAAISGAILGVITVVVLDPMLIKPVNKKVEELV